ncbi:Uncharacterised protein [Segatella buccae]|uniref:Uncharacterized protein n=1 Tax=Segatella buccae TaxID=28126 RepID=A0AAQ1UJ18_9BACT|nr:Uncharacterised protein [Segatella buccae]
MYYYKVQIYFKMCISQNKMVLFSQTFTLIFEQKGSQF